MIQVCFSVFYIILTVTCGYGNANKYVSLYSVRTEQRISLLLIRSQNYIFMDTS